MTLLEQGLDGQPVAEIRVVNGGYLVTVSFGDWAKTHCFASLPTALKCIEDYCTECQACEAFVSDEDSEAEGGEGMPALG